MSHEKAEEQKDKMDAQQNQILIKLADVLAQEALITPKEKARLVPVSYTHLDVYKRQGSTCGASTI